MKVAVIPARGGSKRIPRKNIRPFCGKPMLAWSIDAALASGCFDRVVVSTDDEEIAAVARAHGAEVPFLRPPELADDHAGTVPVVAHAVRWCEAQGLPLEAVCCIYATAPFLLADDIRRGLGSFLENGGDYTFSVVRFPSPIQRALRIDQSGKVRMFDPEYFEARSQDLQPAYHDAAQFYWGRADAWREQRQIFNSEATAVILPTYRVQDIDDEEDWIRAELMFRALTHEVRT